MSLEKKLKQAAALAAKVDTPPSPVVCRCGLSYPTWSIKKTRAFRCSECGADLRLLVADLDADERDAITRAEKAETEREKA